ncbi:hypothetical protein HPB52_015362 [Rhipicephalus sanguineus]|uniref:Uncharacterized protein n=1 Tax=Rhipicephalus sanguineus TaxID=34632 RepID=A0A9D4PN26_RHISA|nr:hypothetical protein HPB52_015362 [Rhipicephalus sanguineus]
MLPRLCPPVPPFHPAYPRAWFWQLDACLAVNGVTAQPLMHEILLDALPAELRHLSAASSSSPQPYDDLCAAVLARYGETYRPLPGTREFRVSPPSTRAVPPGPRPSHDHDQPFPATTSPTSRPATSASIPAPDHPPDEVQEVPAAIGHSNERSVFSTASAHSPSDLPTICTSSPTSTAHDTSDTSGFTTATSPHALEPGIDTDIVSPAVRPPIAEASPVMSNEPAFSTSTLCASCQQELPSSSKSSAAEVRAPNHQRPNLRDAATMTEASEDDLPGSTLAEQAAHVTPATSAGIQHPDLRTSPRVPPAEGASTRTSASSEPAATTPARCHRRFAPDTVTQDAAHPTCGHCAGERCRPPSHVYSSRTCWYFVSRRRQRARSVPNSHRHCCGRCNASPHAHPTFWDRFRHAENRALLLLPTASIPCDPRPLRSSQSRPPETHWSPMVISR